MVREEHSKAGDDEGLGRVRKQGRRRDSDVESRLICTYHMLSTISGSCMLERESFKRGWEIRKAPGFRRPLVHPGLPKEKETSGRGLVCTCRIKMPDDSHVFVLYDY